MSITREDLEQDRLRTILDNTPIASALLSEAALEASWRAALASLPDPNGDVWLFGYGSLIWNPMVEYSERVPAMLYGYHRGFYLYSRITSGTCANPGLVMRLDSEAYC